MKVDRCHIPVTCRLCGKVIPAGEPSSRTMVYNQPCRMHPACAEKARREGLFRWTQKRT